MRATAAGRAPAGGPAAPGIGGAARLGTRGVTAGAGGHALEWLRHQNPWSEADLWQRTHSPRMYALGLGNRWLGPTKRFVIVTPGRSGSELLVDLLDSQPRIVCDREILNERRLAPERFVGGRAAKAGMGGAEAYGFKLFCGHFGYQPMRQGDNLVRRLHDQGYEVILLRRENRVAQALSAAIARQTRWHRRQEDGGGFTPIAVDPVEVVVHAFLFEESDAFLETVVADLPHLRFTYEDDLTEPAAQQATVDRICARLGLAAAPATSDLVRLTPRRLGDKVANFDEVARILRTTRFARWLDDVQSPREA